MGGHVKVNPLDVARGEGRDPTVEQPESHCGRDRARLWPCGRSERSTASPRAAVELPASRVEATTATSADVGCRVLGCIGLRLISSQVAEPARVVYFLIEFTYCQLSDLVPQTPRLVGGCRPGPGP